MSFRGIFIYRLFVENEKKHLKLVLSKFYPTVEAVIKENRDDYLPIPNLKSMDILILEAIGLHADSQTFIESRDSCAMKATKPVFTLRDSGGDLWPLIVLEEDGYLFCCLAADNSPKGERDVFQKSIADAFDFLRDLTSYFVCSASNDDPMRQVMETNMYLATACPFGTPLCCEPDFINAILSGAQNPSPTDSKSPTVAWRPMEFKAKKFINITIQEFIQAFQHENASGHALRYVEVTGEVLFQSEVGGLFPEVSLTLRMPAQYSLTNRLFHPLCSTDYHGTDASQESRPSLVVRCVPPRSSPQPQRLLAYHVTPAEELPIQGFYQLRIEEATAHLLLRLRLHRDLLALKRSALSMEVILPFPGRLITEVASLTVSQGGSNLVNGKTTLLWNVGPSMPKSGELSLSGRIVLSSNGQPIRGPAVDHMCVGQNAYAQIRFKVNDYSYSKMSVDSKSVHCSTEPKVKVTITKCLSSKEYRIWNSLGDTPIVPTSHFGNDSE